MIITIVLLVILLLLLTLFNTVVSVLNRNSILEIHDRLGFGISVPIDQIPQVMKEIHGKVKSGRAARRDRNRELLAELAHLDDSVT